MAVYFIEDTATRRIKIGTAKRPRERLINLQVGLPTHLRLLAAIPGKAKEEKALHERFHSARVTGEWFEATPELLAFIEPLGCVDDEPAKPRNERVAAPFEEVGVTSALSVLAAAEAQRLKAVVINLDSPEKALRLASREMAKVGVCMADHCLSDDEITPAAARAMERHVERAMGAVLQLSDFLAALHAKGAS
jgi:hypothetical protein